MAEILRQASKRNTSDRVNIGDRNNVDIVLLAVYLIGGALRKVDTEDVAVKAHEIAPGRFCWRKYSDQIDIERVRVRLSQAKGQGKLSGVHSAGWRLTAEGTRYVEDKLVDLTRKGNTKVSVGKADRGWLAAERKRLTTTTAFKKSISGESSTISPIEIGEFFRIDEYMSDETRKTKLDRFISAFRSDKVLGQIVTELANRLEGQRG